MTDPQRPYFKEKWFNPAKIKRLHVALEKVTALGSIVEVGSWEGRSTIEIANKFPDNTIQVIDHWLGDLTDDTSNVAQIAGERDVFADFKANMDAATKGNYHVHKMDWRDVDWDELAPISFIFIDGQHTYKEAFDNIGIVLPLMAKAGVVAGDDYTVPQVKKAVDIFFDEVEHCSGPGAAIWCKELP